jgi:hypothetical protein
MPAPERDTPACNQTTRHGTKTGASGRARGDAVVNRKTISSAQLYAILDREFKALRRRECTNCRIPLPYFRRPPDDVSANWAIGTPSECPHGCHVVIAELLAKLWTQYDIEPEPVQ